MTAQCTNAVATTAAAPAATTTNTTVLPCCNRQFFVSTLYLRFDRDHDEVS